MLMTSFGLFHTKLEKFYYVRLLNKHLEIVPSIHPNLLKVLVTVME